MKGKLVVDREKVPKRNGKKDVSKAEENPICS